jgi:pyrimidine operon attenuation protein/uracil phosphoribosyltransferase
MLDSVDFATILQYSPRGNGAKSRQSRTVTGMVKAGRIDGYRKRISEIVAERQELLGAFLNENVTLVPVPRSSPISATDLWPAHEICKQLASLNLGSIATCLIRKEALRKSHLHNNGASRPSVDEQYNSMAVEDYVPSANITLVDDVLTMGRTFVASASRLVEKFPNATIRTFSLIRTNSFVPDIDDILDVRVGTITYNYLTGKITREP